MAEAFARMLGAEKVEAYSAGSRPSGQINSKAGEAMRDLGYDLTTHTSKSLSEIPDLEYDFVATMGCGDECPIVRAKRVRIGQSQIRRTWGQRNFTPCRDLIGDKVKAVLAELAMTLETERS